MAALSVRSSACISSVAATDSFRSSSSSFTTASASSASAFSFAASILAWFAFTFALCRAGPSGSTIAVRIASSALACDASACATSSTAFSRDSPISAFSLSTLARMACIFSLQAFLKACCAFCTRSFICSSCSSVFTLSSISSAQRLSLLSSRTLGAAKPPADPRCLISLMFGWITSKTSTCTVKPSGWEAGGTGHDQHVCAHTPLV
eukprot:1047990-Prymnesium_polylepis.1